MTFEEIKDAVMELSENDQRRFITEVVPEIWPRACLDDGCVDRLRELVDEATVNEYRKQHLDHI